MTVDSRGNVIVCGDTAGNLAGPNAGHLDLFVTCLANDGSVVWTRQKGTGGFDVAFAVSADVCGNVFVVGHTSGDLAQPVSGTYDSFVMLFDMDGDWRWTRQFGEMGTTNEGEYDAFVSKFAREGDLLWTQQFGTAADDDADGVSADGLGNVFVCGWTRGNLAGPLAGTDDAWVARFVVPEPSGATILATGFLCLIFYGWFRRRCATPSSSA